MNRVRAHYARAINGTSSMVEEVQVIYSPGMNGPGDHVVVDTWKGLPGDGAPRHTTQKVDHDCGDVAGLADSEAMKFWEDGWDQTFYATIDDTEHDADRLLLVKIEAEESLIPIFQDMARNSNCIGLPMEKESLVYVGPHEVQLARKRRKAGEERELRYDTVNAKVPADSLAAQVLAALVLKYGGTFVDFTGTPVDAGRYAARLKEDRRFSELVELWGITLPPALNGTTMTRPWGTVVVPAVF